jgi:hypothetical protein
LAPASLDLSTLALSAGRAASLEGALSERRSCLSMAAGVKPRCISAKTAAGCDQRGPAVIEQPM